MAWAEQLRTTPGGWLTCVLALAIASTLMIPITGLIVAVGLVFGTWSGFACAIGGSLLGATFGYEIGRRLWRDAVRHLGGRNLNRLNRLLDHGGVLAVAAVRNVPVAPFGVVNLVAGSLRIHYRSFFCGTLIGMAPGTLVLVLLADQAVQVVRDPRLETAFTGLALVAITSLGLWLLRQKLIGRGATEQKTKTETTS
jgi:uncharacterized membrane protein YdjX (TVP38/TMEM64 family)